jgi:hypothetical protein
MTMHGVQSKTTHVNAPVNASGRNLRRLLHGKPPATRARAAAKLVTGEWQFTRPLPAQAARLCSVHPARVGKALGRPSRPRSDREIDRVIAEIGYEAVMASLDRATRPSSVAAE